MPAGHRDEGKMKVMNFSSRRVVAKENEFGRFGAFIFFADAA
jgi:hypothetical protein